MPSGAHRCQHAGMSPDQHRPPSAPVVAPMGQERRQELLEHDQWVWSTTDDSIAPDEDYLGFEWDRLAGAEIDGRLAGVHSVFSLDMTVPDGDVPAAGLTWVGVHPQFRRRGVLRAMMEHHLAAVRERGTEPVSVLWAAEPGIYGRFGYGLATYGLSMTLARGADLVDVPGTQDLHVRFDNVDVERHTALLQNCYEAFRRTRPGAVSRGNLGRQQQLLSDPKAWRDGAERKKVLVVEDGAGNVRAAALFRRKEAWEPTGPAGTVRVSHATALDPAAARVMWGRLSDLDLMAKVSTGPLATDDPLLFLLTDLRAAQVRLTDGLWVRVVDLPAALSARRYTTDVDVVLEVSDAMCPDNAGRWRLVAGPDGAGCERTSAPADLRLDDRALGAAYLGGRTLAALAGAGLVQADDPVVLDRASRAFGWHVAPYNGTGF